ncbi:hypothetical protein HN385_01135 [archaeon]|jgi:hypothetical protein|nr:hypothetical protein [archaeon]MBT3451147.1 hypothetical protein [archaeon]MBT6869298.1 hypothetical protein [archaeon]MBT7192461.1 hypothetical protein [archaeon]MBT7380537.1 hypothetical protein [archaeon]
MVRIGAESQESLKKREKIDPRGVILLERIVSHKITFKGIMEFEKEERASLEAIAKEINELIQNEEENLEIFQHFLEEIKEVESVVRRAINDIPYYVKKLRKITKKELQINQGFFRRTHKKAIRETYKKLETLIKFQKKHLNQFLAEINPLIKRYKSDKRKSSFELFRLKLYLNSNDKDHKINQLEKKIKIFKKRISKIKAIKRRVINVEIYVQETKTILNQFEENIEKIMKHKIK